MSPGRMLAGTAAALVLAAPAGCGFGEGVESRGEAELRVTRDYGSEVLVDATVSDPSESETVLRALDAEVEVETRYGGAFVQSIDGLAGGVQGENKVDWFFYVDGVESSVGAGEVEVQPGMRIWWDHHEWSGVMRVPAVVGSFPEPLAQSSTDDPKPVRLECAGGGEACSEAGERLAEAGVDFTNEPFGSVAGSDELRVLVGEWEELRRDETAALIEEGPQQSGVFAAPVRTNGEWVLQEYDTSGTANDVLTRGGLVAAVRPGEDPPTWVVSGTDAAGLEAAVAALEEASLRDRYALTLPTPPGDPTPVPIEEASMK
ncbi:MAG: DUF4430 domain-containing protein [Solirubrobacterales bacterium]